VWQEVMHGVGLCTQHHEFGTQTAAASMGCLESL
jgi:hypothetical protein